LTASLRDKERISSADGRRSTCPLRSRFMLPLIKASGFKRWIASMVWCTDKLLSGLAFNAICQRVSFPFTGPYEPIRTLEVDSRGKSEPCGLERSDLFELEVAV